MNLTFLPATEEDWKTVTMIEKACETETFLAYTSEEDSRKYLRQSRVFFIKLGEENIGTISYEEKFVDHAYIDSMTILPEHRRKGYASEAMHWLMEKLVSYKTIDLVTHPRNSASICLYLKLGFIIDSWHDDYFGDGQPRLHLVRLN
jgi:RimJ/RimL family protein N-acetyltransferase